MAKLDIHSVIPTIIEQRYIDEHDYKLPVGWTWSKVHSERES